MKDITWRRYLRFWRPNVEADIDEELQFHFDARIAELVDRGLTPADARRRAVEEFGDVSVVRARLSAIGHRTVQRRRHLEWWNDVLQDGRYALRSLRRAPALSATVVVTLALGIGANTAVFSFLDRIFLRMPSGIIQPDGVQRLYRTFRQRAGSRLVAPHFNYPEFADIRAALSGDATVTAYKKSEVALGRGGEGAVSVVAVWTGENYFSLLGVRPFVGRFFSPDEARPDAEIPVIVISDRFWRSRLGADPNVLETSMEVARRRYRVIGVAPPNFSGVDLDAADLWLPFGAFDWGNDAGRKWHQNRNLYGFMVLARSRADADVQRLVIGATVAMRRGMTGIRYADTTSRVLSGSLIEARGPARLSAETSVSTRLAGVSWMVLLIAWANVANLLLARGMQRRREIAVRLALGISRLRLVSLLLTESLILAAAGGAAALLVARGGGTALRSLLFPDTHWAGAVLDPRLLAFTVAASVLTAIAVGLVPALTASQPTLVHALKEGSRGLGGRRLRFSNALLVTQAALSVVLLVGAGLFVRSLQHVHELDLGFDAERLVFASVTFDEPSAVRSAVIRRDGLVQLAARLAELPGVEQVALASMTPMYGFSWMDLFLPDRDSLPPIPGGFANATGISPAYFSATGIRLVQGRDFSPDDNAGAPPVMIVSQSLARAFWPHSSALGQCVHLIKRATPCFTVVGISEDARRANVVEERTAQYYLPLLQAPAGSGAEASVVVIRVPPEQSSLVANEARRTIKQLFPGGEAVVRQMSEILASQYRPWRIGATLFSLFGALALVVAAVGVYSTITYNVGQRTHEMGVRMALGGRAADLVRLVLGEGLRVAAIGIALGGAIALASGKLVASLLYGTSPRDPAVLVAVAVTLLAITGIACLLPALRAAKVDPVTALRSD